MKKIWLTTDGRPHDGILGVFTSEFGARRYREMLVERYALGKNLGLAGKPLAKDADAWRLGLGPDVGVAEIESKDGLIEQLLIHHVVERRWDVVDRNGVVAQTQNAIKSAEGKG